MENLYCSPSVGNTPERIAFLKESAQHAFDNFNWYGDSKYKMLEIAACVELLGYGVIFLPEFNCPA